MQKLPILLRHLRPALASAGLLLLSVACVGGYETAGVGVVWVNTEPPPPRYEVVTEAPGPEFFWISGYWVWSGSSYDWTAGHWERRPGPHARYDRGRWRHGRGGWYWTEGRWKESDRDRDDHDNGRGRGHDRDHK